MVLRSWLECTLMRQSVTRKLAQILRRSVTNKATSVYLRHTRGDKSLVAGTQTRAVSRKNSAQEEDKHNFKGHVPVTCPDSNQQECVGRVAGTKLCPWKWVVHTGTLSLGLAAGTSPEDLLRSRVCRPPRVNGISKGLLHEQFFLQLARQW